MVDGATARGVVSAVGASAFFAGAMGGVVVVGASAFCAATEAAADLAQHA